MNALVKRLREMDSDLLKDMKRKGLRTQGILLLSDLAEMVRECADEIEMLEKENAQLRHIIDTEQDITEEEALLREIDRELDDVEYLGSYVDGIKALKAEIDRLNKALTITSQGNANIKELLAAMTKERDQWKADYLKQIKLHNKTLDELRAADDELNDFAQCIAENRGLEKQLAACQKERDEYFTTIGANERRWASELNERVYAISAAGAREAKLREALRNCIDDLRSGVLWTGRSNKEATLILSQPADDSALVELKASYEAEIARLREVLKMYADEGFNGYNGDGQLAKQHLSQPTDDTALRQYVAEVLRNVADELLRMADYDPAAAVVQARADELENGK